jgi:heat shock protein HslJ
MVLLTTLLQTLAGLSGAQEPVDCESDYLVQAGDWLSKIAVQHYGDYSLYPAIVLATNARSAVDASYATIADPWLIEPDWKLCIPDGDTARTGFTVDALQNGEYLSEFTASGRAQLTDGEFREPVAPGSATETVVLLTDRLAFGRLSDGQEVAAAILVADPGGSGTFYTLAAVVEQDGALVNVAATFLGDRVQIRSLALDGGEMVVDMVTQGPDDPFCCPTQRVVQRYALQADQLVQVSEEIVGQVGTGEEGLAGTTVALEGTLWKLHSYVSDEGETVPVLPDTEITLELNAGQLSGNAGCNNIFGPYEVAGNGLTFGPMGSTMMACEPEVSEQEIQYLAVLSSVASYQLADDQLQMVSGDGETVLTFTILEPLPLLGTTWRLTGYNNGQGGFASPLSGSEILALFGDDGRVTGPAGCNDYFASYEVEGETLAIGPAGTTRMMCAEPEGIMEQESGYLAALGNAATYQIRGDTLEVWDADGVRVLSYVAASAGGNG